MRCLWLLFVLTDILSLPHPGPGHTPGAQHWVPDSNLQQMYRVLALPDTHPEFFQLRRWAVESSHCHSAQLCSHASSQLCR